jgi:hypothetical protein
LQRALGAEKIAELNDYDVKIVKVVGEFTWHAHADTAGNVIDL